MMVMMAMKGQRPGAVHKDMNSHGKHKHTRTHTQSQETTGKPKGNRSTAGWKLPQDTRRGRLRN